MELWLLLLLLLPCIASAMATAATKNCAVVGVGVLGTSLCRQLLESDPDLRVTGITKSTSRHASIRDEVGSHESRLELFAAEDVPKDVKFENVIFCAPPSGFEDYGAAVQHAVDTYWSGEGSLVFTSSGSVYDQDSGVVTEKTPVSLDETKPRQARLVRAEQACLNAGGCCLRLAGLYNLKRGAHNYWIENGKVAGAPNGLVNQVHYDDAASACVAAVARAASGPYLVSDGNPMTRQAICVSALQAAVYKDAAMPEFVGGNGELATGKVYDTTTTQATLQWRPKYASFDAFMKANA